MYGIMDSKNNQYNKIKSNQIRTVLSEPFDKLSLSWRNNKLICTVPKRLMNDAKNIFSKTGNDAKNHNPFYSVPRATGTGSGQPPRHEHCHRQRQARNSQGAALAASAGQLVLAVTGSPSTTRTPATHEPATATVLAVMTWCLLLILSAIYHCRRTFRWTSWRQCT